MTKLDWVDGIGILAFGVCMFCLGMMFIVVTINTGFGALPDAQGYFAWVSYIRIWPLLVSGVFVLSAIVFLVWTIALSQES
jgi:hypothetical protein